MNNMAKIWKDILWTGKWTFPDKRVLEVRPADIRNAQTNGTAMLRSGLDLPWCWDHQPEGLPQSVQMSAAIYADPVKRAEAAKSTITRKTVGFEVREIPGRGPVLFAGFDDEGLSAADLKSIKAAGKVSCRIDRNFTDSRGNGTKYPGLSISHIAVTPKPLEPAQGPFLMSVGNAKSDEAFYLGYGDGQDEELGDSELPKTDTTVDPSELELSEEEKKAVEEPSSDVKVVLEGIISSLTAIGIPLPKDNSVVDFKTLGLALAMAASMGAKATIGDGLNSSVDSDTTGGSGPPMLMSQAAMAAKYPDRVNNDRANLKAQISLLFKNAQCDGPTRDNLLRDFESYEMSYSGSQIVNDGVLAAVRAIKKYVPKGTYFGTGKTTTVVPRPEMFSTASGAEDHAADIKARVQRGNSPTAKS